VLLTAPSLRSANSTSFDDLTKALRRRGPVLMGEGNHGDTHMNKMRSFRSNYVDDALLVTFVIIIVLGLYFGCRILTDSQLATYLAAAVV
jgi:hypothetical protein